MSTENKKPLVSFIVNAYQQEEFIREAVRSALNQTYEPLEIILSDDSSSDNTFKIMEEEVNIYKGPHKVILNRNKKNIGLIRHLEFAVSLSRGDYIVPQAGDDISHPDRAEILVKALKKPPSVDLVCSDVCVINEKGKLIQKGWQNPIIYPLDRDKAVSLGKSYVLGCAAAYTRTLFDEFPPMSDGVFQEDNVLSFRALVRDGVRIVPEKLVDYRIHSNNILHGKVIEHDEQNIKRDLKNRWAISLDRLIAWDSTGLPRDKKRDELLQQELYLKYRFTFADSSIYYSLKLAIQGIREGLTLKRILGLVKFRFSLLKIGY